MCLFFIDVGESFVVEDVVVLVEFDEGCVFVFSSMFECCFEMWLEDIDVVGDEGCIGIECY